MGEFTETIFKALTRRKFADEDLRVAMNIPQRRFEALKAGKFELSSRESFELERFTGRSCGQLAYEGSGLHDAAFKKLMDAWAKVGKIGLNDKYESPRALKKKTTARRPTRSPVRPALVRGV